MKKGLLPIIGTSFMGLYSTPKTRIINEKLYAKLLLYMPMIPVSVIWNIYDATSIIHTIIVAHSGFNLYHNPVFRGGAYDPSCAGRRVGIFFCVARRIISSCGVVIMLPSISRLPNTSS